MRDSANIFSPAQEVDLGDAIAEQTLSRVRILAENDPVLQRIAERLARAAPPLAVRLRTYIIDAPGADAFVAPGGRVYVSRALIAAVRNEDELAGVLAHELGHLLAHQSAIWMSHALKETMGVTAIAGRRDVFDKMNALVENVSKNPRVLTEMASEREHAQLEADRLGVLIQAAAGYDTAAQVSILDRLLGTKGRTAGFLENLFNLAPDRKRLGELLKNVPAGCAVAPASPSPKFLAWRKQVLTTTNAFLPESLHNVRSRVALTPPLRSDLLHIRFSPDGRHVLAQDGSGITVLSVEPFGVLFRIPIGLASAAEFTPDSAYVTFLASGTHVERWSVADGDLAGSAEIPLRIPCAAAALSPDGGALACVDAAGTLLLIDVSSGETMLQRNNFGTQYGKELFRTYSGTSEIEVRGGNGSRPSATGIEFSPDGRYMLTAPSARRADVLIWDMQKKKPLPVKRRLGEAAGRHFTFIAPDRVMISPKTRASEWGKTVRALLVEFPSGKAVLEPILPAGSLHRATNPEFVVIHCSGKFSAVAVNYATKLIITNRATALDISGAKYVAEQANGDLGLYEVKGAAIATAQLPYAEPDYTRTPFISPDLRWLATSSENRGAIWDLRSGNARVLLRDFDGGFFDAGGHFLANTQGDDDKRRMIDVTLEPPGVQPGAEVQDSTDRQVGSFMFSIRFRAEVGMKGSSLQLASPRASVAVLDARTMKELWALADPGLAIFNKSGEPAILFWSPAGEHVQKSQELRDLVSGKAPDLSRGAVHVAEAIEMATGKPINRFVIDLVDPSIGIDRAIHLDGRMVIQDDRRRVLIFTAGSVMPRVRMFGAFLAADAARGRIAVEKETGRVVIHDADTGEELDDQRFPAKIAAARFSADGRELLVVTSKQEAITIALP